MIPHDFCQGVPPRHKQKIARRKPWLKIREDVKYIYVLDRSPGWMRWIASFAFVILLSAELF
jgi:hypothetical protein